jgi:hypothetical protein
MNLLRVLCLVLFISSVFCGAIITVANITDNDFSIVAINPKNGNSKLLKKIPISLPSHSPIDDTVLCDGIYVLFINDPKKVIAYDLRTNQHAQFTSTDYILSAQYARNTKQLFGVTIDNTFVEMDCQSMTTKQVISKTLPQQAEQMKSSTINDKNFVIAATDTTQAGLPSSFINIDLKAGAINVVNNTCGYFADLQLDYVRGINYGILSSLDQVQKTTDRLMRVNTASGQCELVADLSDKLNITSGNAIYGSIGFDVDSGEQGSYMFSVYDMQKHVVSTIVFDIKQQMVKLSFNSKGATLGNAQFLRGEL